MKKFNPFKFKAIETRYGGCLFRSRLEARHAVFFDTLGIRWEYEREGYDLEGTWYLPDFWLPEMDSFIEIKGQEPTEEELTKTKQLALYTGKYVYIAAGNIGEHNIHIDFPPRLYAVKKQDNPPHREDIEAPCEVLAIIQRLSEIGILCTISGNELVLVQDLDTEKNNSFYPFKNYLNTFIQDIQRQHDVLVELTPFLKEYETNILNTITVKPGWSVSFSKHVHLDGLAWVQCEGCNGLDISMPSIKHSGCDHENDNTISNSPRLLAAYTAAREARF